MKFQNSIQPAILLGAAGLFALLAAAPADAGHGSSGGGHSGGSSHGGSSHGGSSHGGSSHGGSSRGGSFHGGTGHHSGSSSPGRFGSHGSHHFRSHHGFRSGYFPFWGSVGWWWGWPYDSYYSPYYYGARIRYREHPGNARFGRVKTDVEPDEAEVYLDGKYIGTADDFDGFPDYLYLEPGTYHLDFKLQNHESHSVDLEIHRGQTVKIDKRLASQPGHGRLDSFSPPSKGMPSGRVFGKGGEPVRPGRPARVQERDVEDEDESAEAAEEQEEEAPPREAMPRRAEARPAPRPAERARLRWNVKPEDAAIYLDDRYLGTGEEMSDTRRGTTADPGKHTVTVVRPGFKSKTVEVEVKSGAPTDVVVELEK